MGAECCDIKIILHYRFVIWSHGCTQGGGGKRGAPHVPPQKTLKNWIIKMQCNMKKRTSSQIFSQPQVHPQKNLKMFVRLNNKNITFTTILFVFYFRLYNMCEHTWDPNKTWGIYYWEELIPPLIVYRSDLFLIAELYLKCLCFLGI
jgi:hypothetical protein